MSALRCRHPNPSSPQWPLMPPRPARCSRCCRRSARARRVPEVRAPDALHPGHRWRERLAMTTASSRPPTTKGSWVRILPGAPHVERATHRVALSSCWFVTGAAFRSDSFVSTRANPDMASRNWRLVEGIGVTLTEPIVIVPDACAERDLPTVWTFVTHGKLDMNLAVPYVEAACSRSRIGRRKLRPSIETPSSMTGWSRPVLPSRGVH